MPRPVRTTRARRADPAARSRHPISSSRRSCARIRTNRGGAGPISPQPGHRRRAVAEAVEEALRAWRKGGIPQNPGAWLTQAARHNALDPVAPREEVPREAGRHGTRRRLESRRRKACAIRRRGRRPASAVVRLLPPRTGARGSTRAHAASRMRAHHGADRACHLQHRARDGAANRPGQAEDRRDRHPVADTGRNGSGGTARHRPHDRVGHVQRSSSRRGRRRSRGPRPRRRCGVARGRRRGRVAPRARSPRTSRAAAVPPGA